VRRGGIGVELRGGGRVRHHHHVVVAVVVRAAARALHVTAVRPVIIGQRVPAAARVRVVRVVPMPVVVVAAVGRGRRPGIPLGTALPVLPQVFGRQPVELVKLLAREAGEPRAAAGPAPPPAPLLRLDLVQYQLPAVRRRLGRGRVRGRRAQSGAGFRLD